jgi:uncharacterized protein Smg (DUF494 family)
MISELVEVILKIYEGINNNNSPEKAVDIINRENNYNKKVLAAAYSWIYDKILRDVLDKKDPGIKEPHLRVLSDSEINRIGMDNYDYLLHFYNLEILNNVDLEFIVDHLMLLPEGTVDKEKIDALIFALFLDIDNYVLPGSRLILYSSDKIN